MNFEIISLIKNEEDIIENFINHHRNIVDRITLIDNGSTDSTCDIIKKHKDVNLFVKNISFKLKANIINHFVHRLKCDIVIPMDADELMVLDQSKDYSSKTIKGITKDAKQIKKYLQSLNFYSKYKIKNIYNIKPDGMFQVEDDKYRSKKFFFSKKQFISTDPGFHDILTKNKSELSADISYIHLHYRSFEAWYKSSIQKMKARLGNDWNNLEILKNYKGLSNHTAKELYKYFTTGEWI